MDAEIDARVQAAQVARHVAASSTVAAKAVAHATVEAAEASAEEHQKFTHALVKRLRREAAIRDEARTASRKLKAHRSLVDAHAESEDACRRQERLNTEEQRRRAVEKTVADKTTEAARAAQSRLVDFRQRQAAAEAATASRATASRLIAAHFARAAAEEEAAERRQQLAAGRAEIDHMRTLAKERERDAHESADARLRESLSDAWREWEAAHYQQQQRQLARLERERTNSMQA